MSCCVKTCKKNKSADTLFHFPVDEKLQKIWVDILKENNVVDLNWELTENSQICINHFQNSYCIKTGNEVLLTGEAYPTLFENDEYLIEEIFDDEQHLVDNLIETSYEEVIENGDDNIEEEEGEDDEDQTGVEEEIIYSEDLDQSVEEETKIIESNEPIKNVNKLKNLSVSSNNIKKINQTGGNKPKTVDISKKENIADQEQQKNPPMFKVVDGKLMPDSPNKKDEIKSRANESKVAGNTSGTNKAMQAILIGNQYYLVSPNNADGKELTNSQLAAIKEKILSEMGNKKTTGTAAGPPVAAKNNAAVGNKIAPKPTMTPVKKQGPTSTSTPLPVKSSSLSSDKTGTTPTGKSNTIGKNVTTIDLNKGLPMTLKHIMSNKPKKRKIEDEDSETFTVSSSLDIMPVVAKKPRDSTIIYGEDRGSADSNYPGDINSVNMSSILPNVILDDGTPPVEDSSKVDKATFYKLLQDVNKNMAALNKTYWSHVYDENLVVISKSIIAVNRVPKQFISIQIDSKLETSIYKNDCQLTQSELADLNINIDSTINKWIQVRAIIDKCNLIKPAPTEDFKFGITVTNPTMHENYIKKSMLICKQIAQHGRIAIQEHDEKIVSFITEQLSLLSESKDFRSFSINLLIYCYILYLTSPSVYYYLKKILILPESNLLKELGGADISRDFVNVNEHRMNTLSTKINGFSPRDKIIVLHMFTIKINTTNNVSNILIFIISSVSKTFEEIVYFCPTQDTIPISKLVFLIMEIIKKLENITLHVVAFSTEYNQISFEIMKRLGSSPNEKKISIPNPVDKKRKLFLLYDNLSILTAICWDWMSKDYYSYPSQFSVIRNSPSDLKSPNKASFQYVANYIKKQKVDIYFKTLNNKTRNLINQIVNKESSYVDETQKVIFALNVFTADLIPAFESHLNKEYRQTGEFMRIIYDWWKIVSGKKNNEGVDKFKLMVSDKNKEPIVKLGVVNKWVNFWKKMPETSSKRNLKFTPPLFHVLSENTLAYKNLSESLLREHPLDQFWLGTFQVNLGCNGALNVLPPNQHFKFQFR